MKLAAASIAVGFVLDWIIGDPRRLPHPVALIGKLISALEKVIRKIFPKTKKGELAGGAVLVTAVLIISAGVPFGILFAAGVINRYLKFAIECIMCYWLIAARSLKRESTKVERCLDAGDIKAARYAVSMIVGRDTERLNEEEIAKAAVETVAENASDGVIAPIFFMAIGGASFGFFYKAANTMDSMIGYRNEKYMYFGRAAAKLDSILNFIPSRIAAFMMLPCTSLLKMDNADAWKIYVRDRKNSDSPNAGQTESVMAGALDVQLGGDAWYFGKLHKKKTMGDAKRKVTPDDIRAANRLMYLTSFLTMLLLALLSCILYNLVL